MMRHHLIILLAVLPLASCLQPQYPEKPGRKTNGEGSEAALLLRPLALPAGDSKRIGIGPNSLLFADAEYPLIHLTQDGVSSAYDRAEKDFGPESFLEESGKFAMSYNLLKEGWLGLAQGSVKSLNLVSAKLTNHALPSLPQKTEVIGAGYDFIAYYQDQSLHILELSQDKGTLSRFSEAPALFRSLQKCLAGCRYWAFDGQAVFTLHKGQESWRKESRTIAVPDGKSLTRLAGLVTVDENGSLMMRGFHGLDAAGELYEATAEEGPARDPNFENVATIVRESCVGCHASDGFEQESVLIGLKAEILRRVDPERKSETGAMPPPASPAGQRFSAADATLLTTWLASKEGPQNPPPGGGPMNPPTKDPNTLISGELKKLADQYCVSCHSDNQRLMWWTSRKEDLRQRVESSDMPRNRVMPEMDRNKLLELISNL